MIVSYHSHGENGIDIYVFTPMYFQEKKQKLFNSMIHVTQFKKKSYLSEKHTLRNTMNY